MSLPVKPYTSPSLSRRNSGGASRVKTGDVKVNSARQERANYCVVDEFSKLSLKTRPMTIATTKTAGPIDDDVADDASTAGFDEDETDEGKTYWVIKSLYAGGAETVLFPLKKFTQTTPASDLMEIFENSQGEHDSSIVIRKRTVRKKSRILYFKFGPRAVEFNAVRGAFRRAGFTRLKRDDENCRFDNFTAMWSKHLPVNDFARLSEFQKVNHFPGSFELGRKDSLHRVMNRMRDKHGNEYDFYPKSYAWPDGASELKLEMSNNDNQLYIIKPKASSCGKGIKVINRLSQIKNKECIVQKYIPNPMLIEGKKFDLRIYVAVTSFYPLRIYMFEEGLVRFATKPYSTKHIKDKFAHLTNYSINKHSEDFEQSEEGDSGSKWTLTALKKYFADNNMDDTELWVNVKDLIVKTVISAEDTVISTTSRYIKSKKNLCYEIFGFDVLLDSNMKPWLLEVNVSPSLSSSSPMDKRIKSHLITNLLNLVGFQISDRKKLREDAKQSVAEKLIRKQNKEKRSIQTLRTVQLYNLEQYMNDDELALVRSCDDENRRRGMFMRLYPVPHTNYNKFFSSDRYKNELLQKWLQLQENKIIS